MNTALNTGVPNNGVVQFRFQVITLSKCPKLQHNMKNERPGHVTLKGRKTKTRKPTATSSIILK